MRLADFFVLAAGILANAIAQLLLKAATRSTGPIGLDGTTAHALTSLLGIPAFWLALGSYAFSVLVWTIGLSRVPVTQAYPLLSLGYVVNAVAAWSLLGEALTPARLLGTAIVIIGVIVITRS